jgi:hypothetical protein
VADSRTSFGEYVDNRDAIPHDAYPGKTPSTCPPFSFPPGCRQTFSQPDSSSICDRNHNDSRSCPTSSNILRCEKAQVQYAELYGKMAFDVEEMWRPFPVTDAACTLFDRAMKLGLFDKLRCRWTHWPANSSQNNILNWILGLIRQLDDRLLGLEHYNYVPSGPLPLNDGASLQKTDLVVVGRPVNDPEAPLSWHNVRVVGKLMSSSTESNLDLTVLQMANYVREIFGWQPNRRWVLGFVLCGSSLRIWRFDRAGASGSTTIDIHAEPALFLTVLMSYASMSATALGFDPTIFYHTNHGEVVFDPTVHLSDDLQQYPYIYVPVLVGQTDTDASPQLSRTALSLNPYPLFCRFQIVTRGCVCWPSRQRDARDSHWVYVVKDKWHSMQQEPEGAFIALTAPTQGLPHYVWHGNVILSDGEVDDIHTIRSHSLRRSSSHLPKSLPAVSNESENLYNTGCLVVENRIHTRLITGPVGRPLLQFGTYTNLLHALKDAIHGHRHMYEQHKILHRDVSLKNILLNPEGIPGGFLIDFDLAISTETAGARQPIGTFDFMAMDVLRPRSARPHTPVEDLESFFYVLLYICLYYHKNGEVRQPSPSATVFVDPSPGDPDPFKTAFLSKFAFTSTALFNQDVMPTLGEEARIALGNTLQKWRTATFPPAVKGDRMESEPLEMKVQRTYQSVLRILEEGIAELNGI